jgi:hypothetical protein
MAEPLRDALAALRHLALKPRQIKIKNKVRIKNPTAVNGYQRRNKALNRAVNRAPAFSQHAMTKF